MSYEFATEHTIRIDEVARICTQRSREGWEYVETIAGVSGLAGRYIMIVRRPVSN
jgi:hypothetical protein